MNLLYANDRPGEYPESWYAATATQLPAFPPLKGETRADICVVGGGYTGLSAALHLARQGRNVVLLDAQRVGWGASGRNGGQVGSGQRDGQRVLERRHGPATARALFEIGEEARHLVADLIRQHGIDCDYAPGVIHAGWTQADARDAQEEAAHMARVYGYDLMEPLDRDRLQALVGSPVYQGGVLDHGAAHLHPLNYALGLARAARDAGVRIHERSYVHHIAPPHRQGGKVNVRTDRGRVLADEVVLAGNGYLGHLDRQVAARVMPINNFIVATEPLGERAREIIAENHAVADSKFVVNYFRLSRDGRLLFGGGESYGYKFPRDLRKTVSRPMLQVFPQLRGVALDYAWGGTLAITMTRMPLFDRPARGVWSASGYSGHGVALATMAGRILAEAIAGQTGRFDVMASIRPPAFPGGALARSPLLALAMSWYALRDRLGI